MIEGLFAFVVGVARYDQGWTTDSAAKGACEVAIRLRELGLDAAAIKLFIDEEGLSADDRGRLRQCGLQPLPATWQNIDDFWRKNRVEGAARPGKLLTYWSGHGVSSGGRRLFLCRDYSERSPGRIFDASYFMHMMRTDDYAGFGRQRFFADVCGTHPNIPLPTVEEMTAREREVDQLTMYATPDGRYAEAGAVGHFTTLLLTAMDQITGEADSDALALMLRERSRDLSEQPFTVRFLSTHHDEDSRFGRDMGVFAEIAVLAQGLTIPTLASERAFLRTNAALHTAARPQEPGLLAALVALNQLDLSPGVATKSGEPINRAILQFLLRLAMDEEVLPAVRANIAGWIDAHVPPLGIGEAREMIAGDDRCGRLVITLTPATPDTVVADCHLVTRNGWPAEGFAVCHLDLPLEKLDGWIESMILKAADLLEDLEIHFLVDPPLFHRPFHSIVVNGMPLGQYFVCLVHFRARMLGKPFGWPKARRHYIDSLSAVAPKDAPLIKLRSEGGAPTERGILYSDFIHRPGEQLKREVDAFMRALATGAPFLCWAVPGSEDPPDIAPMLKAVLGKATAYTDIPALLFDRRGPANCNVANALAMLWDDQSLTDLPLLKGMS